MKKTIFGLLGVIVIIVFCVKLFKDPKPYEKPGAALHKIALSKVEAEVKVRSAYINDANVLYAAVIDDGSKRDGYALYLCGEVRDLGVDRVKVVKYGSTKDPNRDNAYGVLLGECDCKSY